MLILSILALESARSIRFLYEHFLSGITEKSLTAFYYARYTKQNLVSIVDEYPNLDLIGNARIDYVMYDSALVRTGRGGTSCKTCRDIGV